MAARLIGPSLYKRRRPDRTLIYQVLNDSWQEFQRQRAITDKQLPGFVVKEFSEYLKCGLPEYGFTRLYCDECRTTQVLAFSCKRRGFCPSCSGRRMHEASDHLMKSVMPDVPVRQWVLSLPWGMRYRIAHDPKLTAKILSVFIKAVDRCLKAKARLEGKLHTGSVTFIQRFGSALNLNVHFHVLYADGVFVETEDGAEFHYTGEPSKQGLMMVLEQVSKRAARLLEEEADQESFESQLSDLNKLSISMTEGFGESAGRKQIRFGMPTEQDRELVPTQAVRLDGFSLHAGVSVGRSERDRLERLIRYTARGPIAQDRLSFLAPGRLIYRLKTPWSDGTTHVSFTPLDFVARLVALIPPRGMNLIRYHGVFAPNSRLRKKVVPVVRARKGVKTEGEASELLKRSRLKWSEMLKRAFKIDVTICRVCGGRLDPIAVIKDPVAIEKILECLGEKSECERASHLVRGPPRQSFELDYDTVSNNNSDFSDQRPSDW